MPPPQKLKPHIIVQHHCTPSPLLCSPSCRPPLLGTVDSWLTKSTVSGRRPPSGPWSPLWPAGHLPLYWNKPLPLQSTHTDTCDNKLSRLSLENKHFDTAAQSVGVEDGGSRSASLSQVVFSRPEGVGEADGVPQRECDLPFFERK